MHDLLAKCVPAWLRGCATLFSGGCDVSQHERVHFLYFIVEQPVCMCVLSSESLFLAIVSFRDFREGHGNETNRQITFRIKRTKQPRGSLITSRYSSTGEHVVDVVVGQAVWWRERKRQWWFLPSDGRRWWGERSDTAGPGGGDEVDWL